MISEQDREKLRQTIGELAKASQEQGSNTAWFEQVYEQANGNVALIPWAKLEAHPLLRDWLTTKNPQIKGKALVIGCGLGDDAEILAKEGFQVTAFDISPKAIAWCRQRFPDSRVNYCVADLLELDSSWNMAFDLVFEYRTVQSLPVSIRDQVLEAIARTVAPNGILLMISYVSLSGEILSGPPWPLSESDFHRVKDLGFLENQRIAFEEREIQQFFIEYQRQ
jgi:2-polyprenyl-3-methyl-5-hydroxy-6-metoxy-1,4-benzoquinol methylase